MGWTTCHATHYKPNGNVDRKAEMDSLYTWESENRKVSVLKSAMVGTTYYGAIQVKDTASGTTEVTAAVVLTNSGERGNWYFNFGYKSMEESSCPYYYDCPKSILDLLTEAPNEWAKQWREKCREKMQKPKLSSLPVGTIIAFNGWDGERIELVKMSPAYQFKKAWWYRPETNTYMPSRRIPDHFEVVSA